MCERAEKAQHSQRMSEEYEPGLVSVIIPTFNRADLVREAIQSVLDQTYQNFEIIVVDDGSTDGTEQVLAPYKDKIIYIYQENQGGAAARNTGIKHARGKYIAFLDSDDLWLPEKLEKQLEILEKNEDIAMVYSNIIRVYDGGRLKKIGINPKNIISGNIYHEILLRRVWVSLPTWIIRKACFEEIGGFDPEFRTSHDREMVVRIVKKYQIYGIKEPLTLIRQHAITPKLRGSSTEKLEYYWFKFLDKLFNETDKDLSQRLKKRMKADYYFLAGMGYLKEMNPTLAKKRFLKSILYYPFRGKAYMHFVATLMGVTGLKIMYKVRKLIFTPLYSIKRLKCAKLLKIYKK